MGHSRKDPHSPHRGNFCRPEGEGEKLFLIIVNALGHPKGYERLTFNFLCGYNRVFFSKSNQAVKLSILVHGEGKFWRKKNCDRSGWGSTCRPSHRRMRWARFLGRLGQSGNIYFTVGQYWLIIKINRRNHSLNIGGNMLYNSRKFSSFLINSHLIYVLSTVSSWY